MKHDLCPWAVRFCLQDIVRLNSPGGIYDYAPRTLAQGRIVEAVMRTREGLDRATVVRMVNSLWECES